MVVGSPRAADQRPRFTVVTACFNVAAYLDEFAASLERQPVESGDVEVVAVDDGSTDTTLEHLNRCADRSRFRWTVLSQDNAGQGAARNRGLSAATGEWTTFVDPDDWLDDRYLDVIGAFMDEFPQVEVVAAARVPMYEEGDGLRRGSHPLDRMFESDVLVDLDRYPDYFHGSAPAAFLRTDRMHAEGLTFDPQIRPNFEDAHFIARYLLACSNPLVGFVGSARYFYRRRADGSSSTQHSYAHPGRFAVVPERGMLDLLRRAEILRDSIPFWVQNLVLYELSYYFSEAEQRGSEPDYACRDAVAERFLESLGQIASLLSPDLVSGFRIRPFDPAWRDILLTSLGRDTWYTPYAVVTDHHNGDATVRIRYTGTNPAPTVLSAGLPAADPGTSESIELFGHALLHETTVRVPNDDEIRVLIGGSHLPLRSDWEPQTHITVRPASDKSGLRRPGRDHGVPGAVVARSLRGDRRRRFRSDFSWRLRRKIRHLTAATVGRGRRLGRAVARSRPSR